MLKQHLHHGKNYMVKKYSYKNFTFLTMQNICIKYKYNNIL